MRIKWLGHACFLLEYADGTRVVTDPFGPIGYPPPAVRADIVTVSHGHHDHNAVGEVTGSPQVVDKPGETKAGSLKFTGVSTFHDSNGGKDRGPNLVFCIEGDGMRLCHLGDLGHIPDAGQIKAIGKVDILLLPVGGFYTIDAAAAQKVAELLAPGIIIPMHYKTPAIDFPIETAEPFLQKYANVETPDATAVEITPSDLSGETRVIVLDYK
ncbi:MAG: MBL fold metallo-hydrolase [bacterium]|jgi:L-ascorbate metabolism protein UlaG (beta-lactamase superfamily)